MYKWLEAVAYDLTLHPDPKLEKTADEVIALLAAAQAEDGYLNSYFQLTKKERFSDLEYAHELYCAGHLIEAAIAHHRPARHPDSPVCCGTNKNCGGWPA
ncbi:MAG: glycoside hydrolase family 127 protein [Chloroflexi bacterium]|nr:glycoside hydrolase family 127 protein [Chloroflexota bacterium]MCI0578194.1 glycoside hydrolase family 127 protein [Chloroflexota bacterium]MCI0645313.1 glycoside hydrolase family 127 protein [Chloroflexota bacterium]MCI0729533.1 glycoside hydrolase family 127 protein [Chloroflexota bacterium]